MEILAPVAGRDLKHEERRGVITVKLRWIETQDGAFLLVFHDVMVSTFKFGGNRRFFGVDTADFVGCRGSTRAIRFPVVSDIPVSDVIYRYTAGMLSMEEGRLRKNDVMTIVDDFDRTVIGSEDNMKIMCIICHRVVWQ